MERAHANGHRQIPELGADELYRREPQLGPGARGALEVPDEALVCPFTTPLAYATEALLGGCELRRSSPSRESSDSARAAFASPPRAVPSARASW